MNATHTSVRRLVGALGGTVALGVLTVPSAGAVPQDPNAVVVAQDCTADRGTIVVSTPGPARCCGTSRPRW